MPNTVLLKKLLEYAPGSVTSITRATARGLPLAKLRAKSLGTYLSCSIASYIRFFVSSEIAPLPLSTLDTVEAETPAICATSRIVTDISPPMQPVSKIAAHYCINICVILCIINNNTLIICALNYLTQDYHMQPYYLIIN